ncbi:HflC Membrane protease subunits, stomatin/prohibitin homologs [Sphingomonadaceae bacterium]|jgi:membrane protease subunit HflC|uniref:protease modulator HflC n=1 Tax=Sphingorhabdus sp. TaxID=1902408 RepID=UPI0028EDE92F|nr:protease modulator HflC [uncultured Sphingorhabdus sp.]MCF8492312.1 protease modulator HflC [Sphingomonadaceae bacterium]MCF8498013.1 protease modulator HflC [Sphingomonadaceae bacterium]
MISTFLRNPMYLALSVIAALILMSMSINVVPETQQAIISSYGKVDRIVNPYKTGEQFGETRAGLTFRIPLVEQIQIIDKRVLSVEMEQQEVLSTDQLRLQVDAFARFRITKPAQMYRTIRTEDRLRDQLRTILGSSLRNELGKRTFVALLSAERGEVMENIQTALNREARKYGAEVIDVRIKRADLPAATLQSAYNRMRSARNQEAIAIDAEGQKEAQIIRADAESEAARIYAISYGKDPGFYDFYRAMQSYRQTFQNGEGSSNIILSPQNAYLEKFRNGR